MSFEQVTLGEICDLFNGYAFKSSDYVDNSNTLSCRMSNIRPGGKFDIKYNARYLPDDFSTVHKQYILNDGDVVIAMTDLAGSPKILGVPTIVKTDGKYILQNQRVGKLIIKDKNKVHFPYLQRALNSQKVRSQYKKFAGGGLQINLGKKDLLNVNLPLPPLAEQKKIAAILDAADSLKQKDQQLINHYTTLSQSLFLDMFGDPVSNPMGWDKHQLKYLGKVATGNTPPRIDKENYGSYIEWIKTTNINTPMVFLTSADEMLSKKGSSLGRVVNKNSLLVTCIAGSKNVIGNVAIADRKVAFNQQINSFTPKGANVMFYYYHFVVIKKYVQTFSTNSMKGMINKSKFESIKFISPPIKDQNRFSIQIELLEKQKQQAQTNLKNSEALFNSLLQKAFKGELTN